MSKDFHGLRGPLATPLQPEVEEAVKVYLDFFSGREFSTENFAAAAQKGSELLAAAGGWQEALRSIRRVWVQSKGDHLSGLHSEFFEGLVHPAVLERARHVAIWGVEASADLEETSRMRSSPHPRLKEHLHEAAEQLWEDASKGRSLLCFDVGHGLEGVVSVPMARVPKMNPDRTLSDKGRVIWDATPVNRYCHKSRHPPALQPRHQEVARAILWWKLRLPRIRILLSKKDVSEAFKWIPVRLEDTKLFAADLPAEYSRTPHGITIVYGFLTFGWCGAPGEYMHFAWVIKMAHESFAPENSAWEDVVPFHSFVLMDDTVLIEPDIGLRPEVSVALTERITKKALGERSINQSKDKLEGRLETRKLIWGLIYDTQTNSRSLPGAKLEKAYHLLHLPEFDSGCTRVPLRLIQELRGNQQFWLAVLPGLSPYLGSTNDLLGPSDAQGWAVARGDAHQQKETWNRFWEAIELQRLLVDASAAWEVRFTHPLTAARTVPELLSFPGMREQVVWACGDATPDKIAAVDWGSRHAVVEPAGLVWDRIRRFCLEAGDKVDRDPDAAARCEPGEGLMISLTELLAVVSLACVSWTRWRGKIVIYAGDNRNVIAWLAKRQAKPPAARFLLQLLAALETVGGFRLHAEFIRTYHNQVADSLTREQEEAILREHNLIKTPFSEVLLQTLDRGWMQRALLWDGMDHGDKAAALQLGLRRHPAAPCGLPFPLRMGLACAEVSRDSDVYRAELASKGLAIDLYPLGEAGCPTDDTPRYACLFSSMGRGEVATAGAFAELAIQWAPLGVWADSITSHALRALERELLRAQWNTRLVQVSGRSLQDQCWWKRWILVATPCGQHLPPLPCPTLEEEPVTAPLHTYPMEWLLEEKKVPEECWVPGSLKLDSAMPHLGQATPKPRGTLRVTKGPRRHVWDPFRPLPQLHDGSWKPENSDSLLLLGYGSCGPAARTITPGEVFKLLGGRREQHPRGANLDSLAVSLLMGTPRSLALVAGRWASALGRDSDFSEPEPCHAAQLETKTHTASEARLEPGITKVGICSLPWEDKARRAFMSWLQAQGWAGDRRVAGKGPKRRYTHNKQPQYVWREARQRVESRDEKLAGHEQGELEADWGNTGSEGEYGGQPQGYPEPPAAATGSVKEERMDAAQSSEARFAPGASSSASSWRPTLRRETEAGLARRPTLEEVASLPKYKAAAKSKEPVGLPLQEVKRGDDSEDDSPIGLPKSYKPDGRVEPISGPRDRNFVPASGLKLGSAKVKLLQAISEADSANFESLQQTLTQVKEEGREGTPLASDLERLARQRKEAAEGIQEALETEKKRVVKIQEGEEQYLQTVDDQGEYMQRLERNNPSRPSKSAQPVGSERLTMEINQGVPVWVARRREKTRRRAQARKEVLQREEGAAGPSGVNQEPLESPEEAAAARMEAAQREAADFRRQLKSEGTGGPPRYRRAPDSSRRKETKKRNRADQTVGRNDDATRDTNHAIAHLSPGEVLLSLTLVIGLLIGGCLGALCVRLQGNYRPQLEETNRPTDTAGQALREPDTGQRRNSSPPSPPRDGEERTTPVVPANDPESPQRPTARGLVSSPGTKASDPQGTIRPQEPRQAQPSASRGSVSSPGVPIEGPRKEARPKALPPASTAPALAETQMPALGTAPRARNRVRQPPKRGMDPASGLGHLDGCVEASSSSLWLPACHDCIMSGEVLGYAEEVAVTGCGTRWHRPTCGHIRDRPKRHFRPCPRCFPPSAAPDPTSRFVSRRSSDDASRDTNHAIAHWVQIFLLVAAIYLAGVAWHLLKSGEQFPPEPSETRVGGVRKPRVRFEEPTSPSSEHVHTIKGDELAAASLPHKARRLASPKEARDRQGPRAPELGLRLRTRSDYQEESIRAALDRLAITTRRTYESQLKWWRLFCARRNVHWLLTGTTGNKAEEDLLVDYLLHSACNENRAPGTLKLRLAAIRSVHLSLGLDDPLEGRGRIAMALAGLRRRYKVPTRRAPVTPRMLAYLHEKLRGSDSSPETILLWAAICVGFFFLLRASEFLPLGYLPTSRQLKGRQVLLYAQGKLCTLSNLAEADEVRLQLVGSKTNYNLETNRNHFRSGQSVCPVSAVSDLFRKFPMRYFGGLEAEEPLFRTSSGEGIQREAIQLLLRQAAQQCQVGGTIGSHSLRFGGASALWTAYKDASVVRRYGRWASDAFHTYLWEDRKYSQGMAGSMLQTDLAPT